MAKTQKPDLDKTTLRIAKRILSMPPKQHKDMKLGKPNAKAERNKPPPDSAPSLSKRFLAGRRYSQSREVMTIDPNAGLSAAEIIRLLDLRPHPEGGHFREMFRDPARDAGGRAVSTLIYFLLEAGEVSRWHRVDATEVWHYYAGARLEITISQNGNETSAHRLGPDLIAGERPQFVARCWQSAMSLEPCHQGSAALARLSRKTRINSRDRRLSRRANDFEWQANHP
jgi:predicted cupin superfamily sugar epimerase